MTRTFQNRTRQNRTPRGHTPMIENLESRRLLSFAVAGGVLTVTGSANADRINISKDGTNLTIRENGVVKTTLASAVTKIVVNAGAGNDEVVLAIGPTHGISLPTTLNGQDGDDKLLGGDGADSLNGGIGKDLLVGAKGNDTLTGGDGNDNMNGGPGADLFNGNAGIDTADYHEAKSALSVTLDGVANDGAIGEATKPAEKDNVKTDVENIVGGAGPDKLTGNSLANRLVGGPGNDTLTGLDGKDTLDGGPGVDSMLGGNGDDFFVSRDNAKDSVIGGDGSDSADADASDILTSIEKKVDPPTNQPKPPQPPQPPKPPQPPQTA